MNTRAAPTDPAAVKYADQFFMGGKNNFRNAQHGLQRESGTSPYEDIEIPMPQLQTAVVKPVPPGTQRIQTPPDPYNVQVAAASNMGNSVLPPGQTSPVLQLPPSPIMQQSIADETTARVASSAGTPVQPLMGGTDQWDLASLQAGKGLSPGFMPKGRKARPIS
jgi:hypothetical protein